MYGGKDEKKAEAGGSADTGGSLLATNDLVYILPPDLSVSVNQTHKNQFFQSNTYKHTQRAVCILNTGADYGDLRNSSLEFGIRVDINESKDPAEPREGIGYFGRSGSILNVIKSITISSRSGDEISRIQDFNLLSYHQNQLRYDHNWHETVGQEIGEGSHVISTVSGNANFQEQRFSIPLYLLSDFFGYGRLMPSMVLSGLRVEIEWATPEEAFLVTSAFSRAAGQDADQVDQAITGYSIENPFISIRAVQLTDATQRSLNELSATNGLELVYCDYERTDRTEATQTLNMEIRKAASRALKAIVVNRTTAETNSASFDSFRTRLWDYTQYQWQLGSLYYPQQPVAQKTNQYDIIPQAYKHALIAYEKYKSTTPGKCAGLNLYKRGAHGETSILVDGLENVDLEGLSPYASGPAQSLLGETAEALFDYGTYANGSSVIATTLERSDLFNLSGVPINNSRVLAIRARFNAAAGRTVTSYLKYVRLARVFLNNVEVEQ
jgi:hypothetical protein